MRTLQASREHEAIQEPAHDLGRLHQCRHSLHPLHPPALWLLVQLRAAEYPEGRIGTELQV